MLSRLRSLAFLEFLRLSLAKYDAKIWNFIQNFLFYIHVVLFTLLYRRLRPYLVCGKQTTSRPIQDFFYKKIAFEEPYAIIYYTGLLVFFLFFCGLDNRMESCG